MKEKKIMVKWIIILLAVNAVLFIVSHFAHSWSNHTGNWSEQGWEAMKYTTAITKACLSCALWATIYTYKS